MRFTDLKTLSNSLFEMAAAALDDLKSVIASKIKELPADEGTVKTLREIEDLLRDVNAGGRMGLINKDLASVDDPAVNASQRMLARYIMSIESTPEERNELFTLWRKDALVNKKQLFSGDRVSFAEVFNGYSNNKLIEELVNDVMEVNRLGHGKGEFGLNVLSKSINYPEGTKGDLILNWNGKTYQVEVKTSSVTVSVDPETGKEKVSKSSARFGDQEVSPAVGFEQAGKELNDFVSGTGAYKNRKGFKISGLSGYGVNLNKAVNFMQNSTPEDQKKFMGLARKCISLIFGNFPKDKPARKDYTVRLKKNVNEILDAIESGNAQQAAQAYARASFNYYMARKHDDGVLYIDLGAKTFVWYNSAEALREKGLRFHADTISISATKDPGRAVYPQIYVEPSTFGGERAGKELKKLKVGKRTNMEEFKTQMLGWATRFANIRNVTNQRIIHKMAIRAIEMRLQGLETEDIINTLEQEIPQLQVAKPRQLTQQPAQTTPPVAEPQTAVAPQPATI